MTRTYPDAPPLVSVIMPFFNRVGLACRAVRSVFAQTYSNLEIIVVNDGSTEDDSALAELLSMNSNVNYIKLRNNVGPGAARNIGIGSAKGKYIAFLDSDDVWEAGKLEIQIGIMLRNGWPFSHTSYYRHDTRNGKIRTVRSGLHHYVFPFPAFRCLIATPTVVLERELLPDVPFRTDINFAEDTFLWLELSKHITLHGINKPLATIFVGNLTTALNHSVQAEAFQLLGKEGLANHNVFLAIHAVYRTARRIQRKITGWLR
jgi:teichuronic acid biosynthesis glycosyltransferase TuaG